MKILIVGDTHFTSAKPARRLDRDYLETQMTKLSEISDIYHQNNCEILIQTGDFFDSPRVGHGVVGRIIRQLNDENMNIICVYGQHDIFGHSAKTYHMTPLHSLEMAGYVKVLKDCRSSYNRMAGYTAINIYGAPFGCGIPNLDDVTRHDNTINILIIHDMITPEPLFPDQEIITPRSLANKYQAYDLICCGDYHYQFSKSFSGRWVVNPGALMRKTINKHDLAMEPSVIIFDTDTLTPRFIKLESARSVKETFNLARKDIVDNDKLLEFVEKLKKNRDISVSWKDTLFNVIEEKGFSEKLTEELDLCIEEALNGE